MTYQRGTHCRRSGMLLWTYATPAEPFTDQDRICDASVIVYESFQCLLRVTWDE